MKILVSKNRSAQLVIQSVSHDESLLPGLPIHLSQHVSVSFEMICCTAAFWFSSWMNACIAAAARGSALESILEVGWRTRGWLVDGSGKDSSGVRGWRYGMEEPFPGRDQRRLRSLTRTADLQGQLSSQ